MSHWPAAVECAKGADGRVRWSAHAAVPSQQQWAHGCLWAPVQQVGCSDLLVQQQCSTCGGELGSSREELKLAARPHFN